MHKPQSILAVASISKMRKRREAFPVVAGVGGPERIASVLVAIAWCLPGSACVGCRDW